MFSREHLRPTRRSLALAAALALAACGDVRISYGDYHCSHDPAPGIVVEFVARDNGRPVAVGATGTLSDDILIEQMRPSDSRRGLGPERTYALAGAYDREGVFDVRVETRAGEILQWSNVRVAGDRCGPYTVVLQAELTLYD